MLHTEHLVDMLLQLASLWRILAGKRIRLFEFCPNRWRIFIYFCLIPSLLQIVSLVVVATIAILERDILYIVGSQFLIAWREIKLRFVH